jgi:hypothetical protein
LTNTVQSDERLTSRRWSGPPTASRRRCTRASDCKRDRRDWSAPMASQTTTARLEGLLVGQPAALVSSIAVRSKARCLCSTSKRKNFAAHLKMHAQRHFEHAAKSIKPRGEFGARSNSWRSVYALLHVYINHWELTSWVQRDRRTVRRARTLRHRRLCPLAQAASARSLVWKRCWTEQGDRDCTGETASDSIDKSCSTPLRLRRLRCSSSAVACSFRS